MSDNMPDSIERLNYHTGLFLEEKEFNLEQRYHSLLRRRLNYGLFTAGVLWGLKLDYDGTSKLVKVGKGMAVNRDHKSSEGREILVEGYNVPISDPEFESGDVYIVLSYGDEKDGPVKEPSSKPSTIIEVAQIEPVTSKPSESETDLKIVLGRISIGTPQKPEEPIPDRQVAKLLPLSSPRITSIDPLRAPPIGAPVLRAPIGAPVIIRGTNFNSLRGVENMDITFNGTGGLFDATGRSFKGLPGNPYLTTHLTSDDQKYYFNIVSDNKIEATVPKYASGSGQIKITVEGKPITISSGDFTIESLPDLDPELEIPRLFQKRIGEELTMKGENFFERLFVTFNLTIDEMPLENEELVKVEGRVENSGEFKVVVPHGVADRGFIRVETPRGRTLSPREFRLNK